MDPGYCPPRHFYNVHTQVCIHGCVPLFDINYLKWIDTIKISLVRQGRGFLPRTLESDIDRYRCGRPWPCLGQQSWRTAIGSGCRTERVYEGVSPCRNLKLQSWLGLESKKPWVSGCIDCQASIARCYPLPTIVDDSISRIIFKAP